MAKQSSNPAWTQTQAGKLAKQMIDRNPQLINNCRHPQSAYSSSNSSLELPIYRSTCLSDRQWDLRRA
jgi:hypothetical protein